jgi:hypothetical protein
MGKVIADFTLSYADASVSIAYNLSEAATTFPALSMMALVVRFPSSLPPNFPLSHALSKCRSGDRLNRL